MQGTTISGLLFIGSLVVAIGVGLLVYIRYRRRLKASLREDSDPSLRNHRGLSLREVVPYILIILLLIWNVVIAEKLTTLSIDIKHYQSNMMNRMDQISMQMEDLMIQARRQWEENPLLYWECTLGEYDPVVACVQVIFSIVPKSIGEKDQVIIQCGEDEAFCGKSAAGVYSAMFLIPLFETSQMTATVALLHADGSNEAVLLENILDQPGWLWMNYLPHAYLYSNQLAVSYDKGILDVNGVLCALASYPEDNRVKAVQYRLVKEMNGRVVESQILDWNSDRDRDTNINIQDHFEGVEKNDRLDYYIETESDLGLTVRWPLYSWSGSANEIVWPDCPATVLDKDGKILFRQE